MEVHSDNDLFGHGFAEGRRNGSMDRADGVGVAAAAHRVAYRILVVNRIRSVRGLFINLIYAVAVKNATPGKKRRERKQEVLRPPVSAWGIMLLSIRGGRFNCSEKFSVA